MAEDDLIEALKALAHPLRWRILATLATGERNVGEIEYATGIGQPGLSQQLGVLRKARLVDTRKDAKLVFYSVAEAQHAAVMDAVSHLRPDTAAPVPKPQSATERLASPGAANLRAFGKGMRGPPTAPPPAFPTLQRPARADEE